MSNKPHAREKRIVNKTVKVEKQKLNQKDSKKKTNSVVKNLFESLLRK